MKIFIEGCKYPIESLNETFNDSTFFIDDGDNGIIKSVGYYHSIEKNTLVYMLPKVFLRNSDKTIFGTSIYELSRFDNNNSFKTEGKYTWVRQLSVYFYNSLKEYKKRVYGNSLLNPSTTLELNSNIPNKEYSYMDLVLSFTNFYRVNKNFITFKHLESITDNSKYPKWNKTVRKELPFLTSDNKPIYFQIRNRKKGIDDTEHLFVYFFSILNHFQKEHSLSEKIDFRQYDLLIGKKFERLQENGLIKLKRIKYKYFNDVLRKMYKLCEMYFSYYQKAAYKRKSEFIYVNNYNLIFEDMVDKLFTDRLIDNSVDGISLFNLKHNNDGKIIDHIYDYQSLTDTSNIYYIGDSKYYKPNSEAGIISKYKQITYAKNIIQFNIDLLNKAKDDDLMKYRDVLTEGYNITPNFFIYGYIDDFRNFSDSLIEKSGNIVWSYHYKHRLFDRDSLFVHQYKINFLFVLKYYTVSNKSEIDAFRKKVKKSFRDNFIQYFNSDVCEFKLYRCHLPPEEYEAFVSANFRKLNGKCYKDSDGRLLLAKHNDDESVQDLLDKFQEITLEM